MRRSACRLRVVLIGARPRHRREFARWLIETIEGCSVAEFGHVADLGTPANADAAAFDLAFCVVEAAPPEAGIHFLDRLIAGAPNVPVVALSDQVSGPLLAEAIGHGARGYILTSMQAAMARAAIKLILAGGVFVPAAMLVNAPHVDAEGSRSTRRVAPQSTLPFASRHRSYGGDKPAAPGDRSTAAPFTRREAEIIAALQRGKPNKTIASDLGIGERTVKAYVARLMRKLNVADRAQIAAHSHRPAPKRK